MPAPLFAETSRPPARNWVCKPHAGAIAMSAWCWLVRLCGRAGLRVLARAAASGSGATDACA
eukprot:8956464-Pyramimonas_sp.AAC.1